MKKVLIVMTSLYNGGAERSLVNLLNEFPKDKYEIDLLLFKREGMFIEQVPDYVRIIDTPNDLKRVYSSLKNLNLLTIWKIIANIISNICTSNSREKRGFRWKYFYSHRIGKLEKHYDVALAYISGEVLYYVNEKVNAKKKIVWIHNDYRSAQHPRKYDYSHLKNMSAIVSISDSCVNILKEEFPEFEKKIFMLENITSSNNIINRAQEFIPEEFSSNQHNLLSIGRLHEQKGFDIAINAAEIMKKRKINFKWFIIGNGELKQKLEQQVIQKGVQDCFIFLGTRENPYPYISNCSVFIQPSRYEGKSVVLDEAKILGVPIVATAYPTINDQLKDNLEGIIVPMSPEGLANGLEKILTDEILVNQLHTYLSNHEYGNQNEVEKYFSIIDF